MHRKLDIKKAAPQAALQYSITTAPGFPVAHEGYRLVLLPLSPDTIHRPPLHGPENCHDPILQYTLYITISRKSSNNKDSQEIYS